MKDNFHLYMSLFVIFLVSFFVLIISIPLETKVQEIIRVSSLHPCQKTVMDQYELYRQDLRTRHSLSADDLKSWNNFLSDRMKYFSNTFEQNCQENLGEWLTDEYEMKMKKIGSAGFENED